MEQIVSRDNQQIKRLFRLTQSKEYRQETARFVADGIKLCEEAKKAGLPLYNLYITDSAAVRYADRLQPLMAAAERCCGITEQIAEKISSSKTPQGVFCECALPDLAFDLARIDPNGRYLLLASLQDPGNIGTIIRSGEAFGISGLLLSGDCPDLFSPKVLRAAMGSAFRLPVLLCRDPVQTISAMREKGIRCFAATLDAKAAPIQRLQLQTASCVCIGNEGNGLSEAVIAACGESVYIPMASMTESLNAGIAASIAAWEMFRGEKHDR